ncbi:MAG TPA: FAD:protein FMN transferase, partial [Salinimicrobium sp.]|nr:FAD:protein FMN transferase [Salinimicrobium sp.]
MKQFFILLLCSVFVGCADPAPQERRFSGEALGTTYHIIWYSKDELPMEQALDSIFQRVNQSMSTYIPESDISRINDGDTLVTVDSLFQKVFELSGQVYKESGGYFDPTVGNLVNLYGFGPENTPAE